MNDSHIHSGPQMGECFTETLIVHVRSAARLVCDFTGEAKLYTPPPPKNTLLEVGGGAFKRGGVKKSCCRGLQDIPSLSPLKMPSTQNMGGGGGGYMISPWITDTL